MRGWRRDDAYEIDVRVSYELVPIVEDVVDTEFFCDCFATLVTAARDCHNLRSHAISKPRDLRRAGKPRPNDSNSYRRLRHDSIILATDYTDCTD